jgi:predicted ATPase/DNA-binding XRE family transcriptional regulator
MEQPPSFGDWLRRTRKALDLTQAALGRKVGCSEAAIRKFEAEERRPSTQIAERLAAVCDVGPSERPDFVRFARGNWPTPPSPTTAEAPWRSFTPEPRRTRQPDPPALRFRPANNLPLEVTRFFGRQAEIAALTEYLAENRLVTLTGFGGVGKTRLSLRVAVEALRDFADGVWRVELAALFDPALVAQQAADAVGVRSQAGQPILDTLTAFLLDRQALLVLDNCEQLLAACAGLADTLLHTCPRLVILATSREPLGVSGEMVFPVPPLPVPDPGHPPAVEKLDDYAALSLFVDRARLARPDYQVTPANVAALTHICRQLDGIPLALELAAARMRLLNIETLAARLDDDFRLLTGGSRGALPRQQTLRATIEWSYNLLSEGERQLLQRLSVFAGGCTLPAAEAVCGDASLGEGGHGLHGLEASQVLDCLSGLVDKSMVQVGQGAGDEARYRLLEMVRQFGQEKLLEGGASERLSQRHAEYFLRFAETNGPQLWYKERPAWIKRFNAERDNLRLALEWSFSSPAGGEIGSRLIVALHPLWLVHDFPEPQIWFPKAIAYCQDKAVTDPALTASVLANAGYYTPVATLALMQQGLALSRGLGPAGREILLEGLGTLVTLTCGDAGRDWDEYQALLDERDALIQSLGPDAKLDPRFYRAGNILLRAQAEFERGQYERATALALESIRWFEACAHAVSLIWPYRLLGQIANKTEAHAKAMEYFSVGLRLAIEDDDTRHGQMLIFLCETAMYQADWAQALEYCQAFIKLAYEKETPFWVLDRLEMAAMILVKAGRYQATARLSGAAEALTDKLGRKTSAGAAHSIGRGDANTRYADVSLDALVPDWRTRADGEAIRQAWDAGRAMSYPQVVAYALGEI